MVYVESAVRGRQIIAAARDVLVRDGVVDLWPLLADAGRSAALGFINRGGTLDVAGMLFANRSTWAHVLEACAGLLAVPPASLLGADELAALAGTGDPRVLR